MWLFFSRRLRQWLIMAFLLPLAGRAMQAAAPRVAARNPRAGDLLSKAGGYAAAPRGRRRRRRP